MGSLLPIMAAFLIILGISKLISNHQFQKKIENEFNKKKEILEEYKNKILDLMEKIAKNIIENLEEIKISQKTPMNNIIRNEHEFAIFKDEFYNYIKKYC